MFTVDNLQSKPYFRSMHPAEKLLFAAVQVVLCTAFASWQLSALSAAGSIALLMMASPNRSLAVRLLIAPAAFLLPACLSVAVEIDAADYWHSIPVFAHTIGLTPASIQYAAELFARSFASSCALIFVAAVTPVHQIEYLLRRAGLPQVLVDLFGMVYRFIGLLLTVFIQIQMAQQARAQSARLGGRVRGAGLVAGALLRKAVWYQQWASYSAQARGYSGMVQADECEVPVSYPRMIIIALYALAGTCAIYYLSVC